MGFSTLARAHLPARHAEVEGQESEGPELFHSRNLVAIEEAQKAEERGVQKTICLPVSLPLSSSKAGVQELNVKNNSTSRQGRENERENRRRIRNHISKLQEDKILPVRHGVHKQSSSSSFEAKTTGDTLRPSSGENHHKEEGGTVMRSGSANCDSTVNSAGPVFFVACPDKGCLHSPSSILEYLRLQRKYREARERIVELERELHICEGSRRGRGESGGGVSLSSSCAPTLWSEVEGGREGCRLATPPPSGGGDDGPTEGGRQDVSSTPSYIRTEMMLPASSRETRTEGEGICLESTEKGMEAVKVDEEEHYHLHSWGRQLLGRVSTYKKEVGHPLPSSSYPLAPSPPPPSPSLLALCTGMTSATVPVFSSPPSEMKKDWDSALPISSTSPGCRASFSASSPPSVMKEQVIYIDLDSPGEEDHQDVQQTQIMEPLVAQERRSASLCLSSPSSTSLTTKEIIAVASKRTVSMQRGVMEEGENVEEGSNSLNPENIHNRKEEIPCDTEGEKRLVNIVTPQGGSTDSSATDNNDNDNNNTDCCCTTTTSSTTTTFSPSRTRGTPARELPEGREVQAEHTSAAAAAALFPVTDGIEYLRDACLLSKQSEPMARTTFSSSNRFSLPPPAPLSVPPQLPTSTSTIGPRAHGREVHSAAVDREKEAEKCLNAISPIPEVSTLPSKAYNAGGTMKEETEWSTRSSFSTTLSTSVIPQPGEEDALEEHEFCLKEMKIEKKGVQSCGSAPHTDGANEDEDGDDGSPSPIGDSSRSRRNGKSTRRRRCNGNDSEELHHDKKATGVWMVIDEENRGAMGENSESEERGGGGRVVVEHEKNTMYLKGVQEAFGKGESEVGRVGEDSVFGVTILEGEGGMDDHSSCFLLPLTDASASISEEETALAAPHTPPTPLPFLLHSSLQEWSKRKEKDDSADAPPPLSPPRHSLSVSYCADDKMEEKEDCRHACVNEKRSWEMEGSPSLMGPSAVAPPSCRTHPLPAHATTFTEKEGWRRGDAKRCSASATPPTATTIQGRRNAEHLRNGIVKEEDARIVSAQSHTTCPSSRRSGSQIAGNTSSMKVNGMHAIERGGGDAIQWGSTQLAPSHRDAQPIPSFRTCTATSTPPLTRNRITSTGTVSTLSPTSCPCCRELLRALMDKERELIARSAECQYWKQRAAEGRRQV